MRHALITFIATVALVGVAGCGSDNDDAADQATTTTTGGGQVTATTDTPTITQTTTTTTEATTGGDQLSPQGRAVLDASQDLAADVSTTGEEFARGRIDEDEAMARLEIARDRAAELRGRAEQLPASDRGRERLVALNEEIGRTAAAISRAVSSGREASRDEIDRRIAQLRDEAQSAFDAVRKQLNRQAQERFRDALDRIGM